MTGHGDCCLPIRGLLAADIAANADRESPQLSDVLLGLLWARGVQASLLHRLAHAAWRRRLIVVSEVLLRISQLVYGIDISYRASIGPGLVLRHAMNVVVGSEAQLGRNVHIFHGVTIGKRLSGSADRPDGMPTIEDGVLLGAGCAVLGPITIGRNSIIGANAVVTRDLAAGALAVGH
jgi:serine O-acetyltransferase